MNRAIAHFDVNLQNVGGEIKTDPKRVFLKVIIKLELCEDDKR